MVLYGSTRRAEIVVPAATIPENAAGRAAPAAATQATPTPAKPATVGIANDTE